MPGSEAVAVFTNTTPFPDAFPLTIVPTDDQPAGAAKAVEPNDHRIANRKLPAVIDEGAVRFIDVALLVAICEVDETTVGAGMG